MLDSHIPLSSNHRRKLPNTRLRCDADVGRLKSGQEVEVIVRGVSDGGGRGRAGSGSFTNQPILY